MADDEVAGMIASVCEATEKLVNGNAKRRYHSDTDNFLEEESGRCETECQIA